MTYVSQITMLCTLNLYSAVSHLNLNKTGRIKKNSKEFTNRLLELISEFSKVAGYKDNVQK